MGSRVTLERLAWWRAYLGVLPLAGVARAGVQRLLRPPGLRDFAEPTDEEAHEAARALASMPRVLPVAPRTARALYRMLFPDASRRARERAQAITRGEIELFGVRHRFGARLDWHRDPCSGRRFDASLPSGRIDLPASVPAPDPRACWELGRCEHLLDLGVAAALHPDLAMSVRAAAARSLRSFIDDNPPGRGIHWTSPLEAALRSVNWLVALELLGGVGALRDAEEAREGQPRLDPSATYDGGRRGGRHDVGRRVGGALLAHGRFIARNLEDRGAVAGNHLLGDLVGLVAIGVALRPLPEAARWLTMASPRLGVEARRQVLDDGGDFEGSTAYHRFVLELLGAADLFLTAAGVDAGLSPVLARMFERAAACLGPGGLDLNFGDSDDGRCLPLRPRAPRDHAYLVALGAMRFGVGAQRSRGAAYAEEAVWLGGAAGYRRWRAVPERSRGAGSVSLAASGIHVLRAGEGGRTMVAMRCGGHGQRAVGGHSHNDQLSLAVFLDGKPLVVDPGTGVYLADPMWRDRHRGTAAHATVVVEGEEQSPLWDARPFALPDAARARLLHFSPGGSDGDSHGQSDGDSDGQSDVRGDGDGIMAGEHRGYRRLPCRAVHRREVTLYRRGERVLVSDTIEGRGRGLLRRTSATTVEARFPLELGLSAVRGGGDEWLEALEALEAAADGPRPASLAAWIRRAAADASFADELLAREAVVVLRDGRPWAALVPLADAPSAATRSWPATTATRAPATARPSPAAATVRGWVSPRYGARTDSVVVCFTLTAPLPLRLRVAMFRVVETNL